jgi:lysophospholipase L1-like esterase
MSAMARRYNDFVLEFAAREGHFAIDLDARLPASHEVFYDDVHFNIAGAERVAEIVADGLLEILARLPAVKPAAE